VGQNFGQEVDCNIPPAFDGINVNCCANPTCKNFLVAVKLSVKDKNYSLTGKGASRSIKCRSCGKHYNLKSNRAIAEEVQRLNKTQVLAHIAAQDGTSCSNSSCANFGIKIVDFPHHYRKIGFTPAGNQRYQCQSCGKRFTFGSRKRISHPQTKRNENSMLFKMLCNKSVGQRLTEITELSQPTIYRKIDMFYERVVEFMARREAKLPSLDIDWLRLSVDRQFYNVNWTSRKDQRNVVLSAIASGDRQSGYIFGMDVDYDPSINLAEVQDSVEFKKDLNLPPYLRNFARIWTDHDYDQNVANKPNMGAIADSLMDQMIAQQIDIPLALPEIEKLLEEYCFKNGLELSAQSSDTKLPTNGALIHLEYTMYAHFIKLRKLLNNVNRLAFYLDYESGIDRALLTAFPDWVDNGRLTALYVSADKTLGTHKRQALDAVTKRKLEQMVKKGEARDLLEAAIITTMDYIDKPIQLRKNRKDIWYSIPIHRVFEANKYVCFITDTSDWKAEWKAARAVDASLRTTDSFFNLARRRLSSLERPILGRANNGALWDGYSPYDPHQVEKMIQILRCYYNYVLPSKRDGMTPAQRIGLAKGAVEIRKILYPRLS